MIGVSRRAWQGFLFKKHDLTFPSFVVARITGGKLIPSDVKQAAEVSQWVNIADQEVRFLLRDNRRTDLIMSSLHSSLFPTRPSPA